MLYDTKKSSGLVYRRMKYYQRKSRQAAVDAMSQLPDLVDHVTEDEKQKTISFIRTCVMPRDEEVLKVVLKETAKMRQELLKTDEFFDTCKFYITAPHLVSADFIFK